MNNDIIEALYLYALSLLPVRRLEIFEHWREEAGSFESAYANPPLEYKNKINKIKADISIEKLYTSLEATAVHMLPYYDSAYPTILKEIYDAPPVLFYRGDISALKDEASIAIVGSRKMSTYGALALPLITNPLLDGGITIVSGLAYGVDSMAHAACTKRGMRTIAVLGSGIDDDTIYPRTHKKLAHDILDNGGVLLSEHPPGTPGFKPNFIARNRIIAGLSLGVVIIECKTKSGALLTADYAADFNRNLYAVPGPIYSSLSEGPNMLIKNGAQLITSGAEILEDLSLAHPKVRTLQHHAKHKQFTDTELRVLKCMQDAPVTIDAICRATNLNSSEVGHILTTLELQRTVKNYGAQGFMKT